jgi:hypothetical protein
VPTTITLCRSVSIKNFDTVCPLPHSWLLCHLPMSVTRPHRSVSLPPKQTYLFWSYFISFTCHCLRANKTLNKHEWCISRMNMERMYITLFTNWWGVESKLGPLGTSPTYCPIVPAPGDYENGEFGGMNGRGNRSTWRKPAPMSLCPPQIPLDQTQDWTRATAVGSQWLTASAMAWPWKECNWNYILSHWEWPYSGKVCK